VLAALRLGSHELASSTAQGDHRTYHKELRIAIGPRRRESGLVCTTEIGTAIDHRNARRRFHRLVARGDQPDD
jgi:hypothetical protein